MTHLFASARSAYTSVVRTVKMKESVMRSNRMMATLVAASVLFATLTGCTVEDEGAVITTGAVTVHIEYPAICEDDAATAKPDFCTTPLSITRKVLVPNETGDNGRNEVDSVDLEVARLAGQLDAENSFPAYPIKAGQNAEMHLVWNVKVPDGYELQEQDGGPRPSVLTDLGDQTVFVKFASTGNGGTGGSNPVDPGKGDFCADMVDADGNPFDEACDFTVDNAAVEVTEDAELCPDGVMISGYTAGEKYTIGVDCPDGYNGEQEAKAVKDEVTGVTIEVTKKTTSLCYAFGMKGGGTVVDTSKCNIKDLSTGDLVSAPDDSGICEDNSLYFPNVGHGERIFHVKCEEGEHVGEYTLVQNTLNHKSIKFELPTPAGDACYVDQGDNVNPAKLELPLQMKLGHTDGEVCLPENQSTDYSGWRVTGVTDNADCNDFGDPSCLIGLKGSSNTPDTEGNYEFLTVVTTQEDLDTLPAYPDPNNWVMYLLTIDDGNGQSFVMTVHAVNGPVSQAVE